MASVLVHSFQEKLETDLFILRTAMDYIKYYVVEIEKNARVTIEFNVDEGGSSEVSQILL